MGGIGGSSSSRYRHHEWLWSPGLLKEKSWALASFQIVRSDLFHGRRGRPFDLSNPGAPLLALVLLGFLNPLGIHIALVPISPGSLGLWVVNASSWVDCPCAAITKFNMSLSKSPCLGENTLQNKKLLYYTAKRRVPRCSKCHLEGSSSGHISGMCEGPGTTNLSPEFRQLGQVLARLLVVELVQAEQAAKPAFAATASAAFVASAGQLPGQSWHDENCHA